MYDIIIKSRSTYFSAFQVHHLQLQLTNEKFSMSLINGCNLFSIINKCWKFFISELYYDDLLIQLNLFTWIIIINIFEMSHILNNDIHSFKFGRSGLNLLSKFWLMTTVLYLLWKAVLCYYWYWKAWLHKMLMCSKPDLEILQYAAQIWGWGEVPWKIWSFLGLNMQF